MKKIVFVVGVLALGWACLWIANPRSVVKAAGGTDNWPDVSANCVGVNNTAQHICEFVHTQVVVATDPTRYDQWSLIVVEPGVVTSVNCKTKGDHIFQYMGAVPRKDWGFSKDNPWAGAHYGNVGICRGWINGGTGPVTITATYQ